MEAIHLRVVSLDSLSGVHAIRIKFALLTFLQECELNGDFDFDQNSFDYICLEGKTRVVGVLRYSLSIPYTLGRVETILVSPRLALTEFSVATRVVKILLSTFRKKSGLSSILILRDHKQPAVTSYVEKLVTEGVASTILEDDQWLKLPVLDSSRVARSTCKSNDENGGRRW